MSIRIEDSLNDNTIPLLIDLNNLPEKDLLSFLPDIRQLIEDKGVREVRQTLTNIVNCGMFNELPRAMRLTKTPDKYEVDFAVSSKGALHIDISIPPHDDCARPILSLVNTIRHFNWAGEYMDFEFPFCFPPQPTLTQIHISEYDKKIKAISYTLIIPKFNPSSFGKGETSQDVYNRIYAALAKNFEWGQRKLYLKINEAWASYLSRELGADIFKRVNCSILELQ